MLIAHVLRIPNERISEVASRWTQIRRKKARQTKDHLVKVSDEGTERDGSLMGRSIDQGSKARYDYGLMSQRG